MTEPLLDVEGLTVTFPAREGPREGRVAVVRDVALRMGVEKVGIVGESGSGKSLTARALMGLVPPPGEVAARRLTLAGTDLRGLDAAGWRRLRGRTAGMILQDPKFSLNPVRRVGHQVEETLRLHERLGRRERRERALAMLRAVGIEDALRVHRAYPHELSGGMGQRAMIAAMLVTSPRLLIADEPTSALDVIVRERILHLLDEMVAVRGLGLILISHDLTAVARFCDRVLVMYRGRVVETLDARRLDAAEHPYTRGLIACMPSARTHGRPLPVLDRDPAWEAA